MVDKGFYCDNNQHSMTDNEIAVLKFFAASECVSVIYYNGGKCYTIPAPAILWDDNIDPSGEYEDYTNICVDCRYQMQFGIPFLFCTIISTHSESPLEQIVIQLNKPKLTKHQRDIMTLINTCSKRVITMEMARNKYAITSAVESMNLNKQYS